MERSELFQPCSFWQCSSWLEGPSFPVFAVEARSSAAGSRERASSSSQAESKARSRGQLRATCRSGVNSLRKISAGHFGPIHRATFSRSWHQCFVPFWDRQKKQVGRAPQSALGRNLILPTAPTTHQHNTTTTQGANCSHFWGLQKH